MTTFEQLRKRAEDEFDVVLLVTDEDEYFVFDKDSGWYSDTGSLEEMQELMDNSTAVIALAEAARAVGF